MIVIIKKSLLVIVGGFFATSLLFTQSAFAASPSNQTKPGWGHGDKNHIHTGPPGHSVSTGGQVNFPTNITFVVEKGAKLVVNIFNGISQVFHISA